MAFKDVFPAPFPALVYISVTVTTRRQDPNPYKSPLPAFILLRFRTLTRQGCKTFEQTSMTFILTFDKPTISHGLIKVRLQPKNSIDPQYSNPSSLQLSSSSTRVRKWFIASVQREFKGEDFQEHWESVLFLDLSLLLCSREWIILGNILITLQTATSTLPTVSRFTGNRIARLP